VGKALKSLRAVGKEGEKILVETQWKIMEMTIKLLVALYSLLFSQSCCSFPYLTGVPASIVDGRGEFVNFS
jgi:hypothetical protein